MVASDRDHGALHILRLLRVNIRWVVSIVILTTVVAGAAAFLMKPVYRASVTLFPVDTSASALSGLNTMSGGLGSLASLAGLNIGSAKNSVEAIATLKSRQFTENFIRENQLLTRLYSNRWDSTALKWQDSRDRPTMYEGYKLFDKRIRRVTEDPKTGLVTLDIDWIDSAEAARWANDLVKRINEVMRQRTISEATASLTLLKQELNSTTEVPLQQAISSTIESNIKRRTLAIVRPEYAFTVVDPAEAVDKDKFIRPNRALYIASGLVIGILLSIGLVLWLDALGARRNAGTK